MSAPKGDFVPVLPLDKLILDLLPPEGTTFMSVYPEGPTALEIQKKIADGKVPTSILSSRLRLMRLHGYVIKITIPRQSTAGWQITPKGKALFPPAQEVSDGS